jgi:hypothetical protein
VLRSCGAAVLQSKKLVLRSCSAEVLQLTIKVKAEVEDFLTAALHNCNTAALVSSSFPLHYEFSWYMNLLGGISGR